MTPHSEQHGARPRRSSRAQLIAVVVPAVLAGLVGAFAHSGRAEPPAPVTPRAQPAPATGDARAVATFEGGQITIADLDAAVANKSPYVRRAYAEPGGREKLLHEMVDYALLIQEATQRGYADHPGVRDAMVLELANRVTAQVAEAAEQAAPPVAEQRAYYEAHRARFEAPELRRASFVRLPTQASAAELYQNARRLPLDEFRTLAVRLDLGGKGSEIGYVDAQGRPGGSDAAKRVDPVLVGKMFSIAEVGQYLPPFEHQGAFYVLRLTARSAASGATFESAADRVREAMLKERQTQAISALVEQLRKEHLGALHPELADQVVLEPAKSRDVPAGFPTAPPDPRAPTAIVEPDGA